MENKPNIKIENNDGISINSLNLSLSEESLHSTFKDEHGQSILNQKDLESIFNDSGIDFQESEDQGCPVYKMAVKNIKKMTTKQTQMLYRLNKKVEKYQNKQLEYEKCNGVKDNIVLDKSYLKRRREVHRDRIKKFRTTSIIPAPNIQIELRIGDQLIILNSSFLNKKQINRLKTSMSIRLNDYYTATNNKHQVDESCYDLQLKSKSKENTFIEQVDNISKAHNYYASQIHTDAKKVSLVFEALLHKIILPVEKLSLLLRPKTYIKKISEKTMKWIKTQNWILRKYLVGPDQNVENLVSLQVSEKLLEQYGFYNQKDITKEKGNKQMLNLTSSFTTRNHVNFMINRYEKNNEKSFKIIEKQKIEQPDKIILDNIYIEKLDGTTKKIDAYYWLEKYTEEDLTYIQKYTVVLEKI